MEAVKAMKEGKRVRLEHSNGETVYNENVYFYVENNRIKSHTAQGGESERDMNHVYEILSDEYVIIEEKKTLSDKFKQSHLFGARDKIHFVADIEDVKEAIKEFMERIENDFSTKRWTNFEQVAKETFGERLVRS